MKKWHKALIVIGSLLIVVVAGGLFLLNQFVGAFALPKIEITAERITTNGDFINGITIEQLEVDSLDGDGIPARYTVYYQANCYIDRPEGSRPVGPKKIYFDKTGNYWWTAEEVDITYAQDRFTRELLTAPIPSTNRFGGKRLQTCPIKLQKEQWYFFRVRDPRVIGLFFYIDKDGKEHQKYIASGVSPI